MTNDEKLQQLIENLERMNPGKITIQMRWFITQAQSYLNGEYATIDQALGLEEDTSE